jgi:Chromo (CHRromatin Organisation MOdifier) domain
VDYIEGHRLSKDSESIEFFVRWKDYSATDNTWEGFEFFAQDAPELAQRYLGKIFTAYKVPRTVKDFAAFVKENEKLLQNGGIIGNSTRKNKDGDKGHTTTQGELTPDTKIRIISQL